MRGVRRMLYTSGFVALGAATGKACQYAAVGCLGDRLGFAGASLVGLAPFMTTLVLLGVRYPHHFRFRQDCPAG